MDSENKFTLCINTFDRAQNIIRILTNHDLNVTIQKIDLSFLSKTQETNLYRLLIDEENLLKAVKVLESIQTSDISEEENVTAEGSILLPVDFKSYSLKACKLGFEIANRFNLRPVILNAVPVSSLTANQLYDDSIFTDNELNLEQEITDVKINLETRSDRQSLMNELSNKIIELQQKGEIPDIKFSCVLNEGVPEDVIKEYCKIHHPLLIVMATRCSLKKGEDMLGSVTAEILDSCLLPVFSVPEEGELKNLKNIKRIAFLCNLNKEDTATMEAMMRMFDYPEIDVTLIPISDKNSTNVASNLTELCNFFTKVYPDSNFSYRSIPLKNFMEEFKSYESEKGIDMILVSNKKRNIFARLLKPGIAHKLLFERDLPMLVFPR